ncbi:DUF3857 domain-containing protein [Marinobacter sp. JSM 1782161]|uniref:DUF3857 domain-containing protein n=1 Tax=Marinobacter sp. JSM 1782161 TaxID=2685906 RepID=UPI001402A780|nr:DUF3857 domain-containing protein [Marinobacter sp. JSM 1782161]
MRPRPALPYAGLPIVVRVLFCLLLITAVPAWSAQVPTGPAPDWVEPVAIPASEPDGEAESGSTDVLLFDEQVNLTGAQPQQFTHIANHIRNAEGLQDNSSLSMTYDPDYESIVIHRIRIHRQGQVLDRLADARFEVYQRESDLERQMYNGTLTVHTVLDDLRVGDTVEYSYSIIGDNPVFGGHFSSFYPLQWSVPLARQSLRILTPADAPLTLEARPKRAVLDEQRQGGTIEYRYQQDNVPARTSDSEAPAWYSSRTVLTLSQFADWPAVHAWATDLFRTPDDPGAAVEALAEQIRDAHASDEARLEAALAFVQQEIRYVGIELGEGSHRPTPPAVTLQRRFGDCKDKTVLLNTLLRLLDIKANAVLVDTGLRQTVADEPPTPLVFDHVITRAQLGDQVFWLDGTHTHQRGALPYRTPAHYGAGLILGDGPGRPQVIEPEIPPTAMPRQHVTQHLVLPEDADTPAELTIVTEMGGSEASYMRGRVARSGKQFHEDYLNYYANLYPGLERIAPTTFRDDPEHNRVVIEEHYRVPNIWQDDAEAGSRTAWLDGDLVSDFLYAPEVQRRESPYALYHPIQLQQALTVDLNGDWNLSEEHEQVRNAYFDFRRDVTFVDGHLTVSHRLDSHAGYVPANDMTTYLDDLKRVNSLRYYGLEQMDEAPPSSMAPWIVGVSLVLLLIVAGIVDYVIDRGREKAVPQGRYYPVSTAKFVVLNLLSLGCYSIFWAYRNWAYIRERDGRSLWAWARGFFLGFTLYGLYADARKDHEEQPALTLGRAAIVLLALGYFIFNALLARDNILVSYAGLALSILCLLPLQRHFNRIEGDTERFRFNSRWRPRHGILALFFIALFSYDVGTATYLLPPNHVMAGSDLPAKTRLFLDRHKLLAPDETLLQFYSQGVFDYTEDGNGLTDRGVFSYWSDTNARFHMETARYSDIADLRVTPGDFTNPTAIQVIRNDGSYFMLLLSTEKAGDRRFSKALRARWNGLQQTAM